MCFLYWSIRQREVCVCVCVPIACDQTVNVVQLQPIGLEIGSLCPPDVDYFTLPFMHFYTFLAPYPYL